MPHSYHHRAAPRLPRLWCVLVYLGACLGTGLGAGPALAQYKIVDTNGRVTYTDMLRPADAASAQPMRGFATNAGNAGTLEQQMINWPSELRDAAKRFPVVLYSQPGCSPCDAGRSLLVGRGVPFTEKLVQSIADFNALAGLMGGERSLPSLSIGQQLLKGLSAADWQTYLDAAGYPRESKLPTGYRLAAPTPLVPVASASSPAQTQEPDTKTMRRPPRPTRPSAEQEGNSPPALRF